MGLVLLLEGAPGLELRPLLSESLLLLLIQLVKVRVGERLSLSSELVELRFDFFLVDSTSRLANSAWVAGSVAVDLDSLRLEDVERVEAWLAERVLRVLLPAVVAGRLELDFTPFSSRCKGHGF